MKNFFVLMSSILLHPSAHAVVGGNPLPEEWFPSGVPVVGIQTKMNCSAVVIGENFLLTAAHCLEEIDYHSKIEIRYPATGNTRSMRVANVHRHKDFNHRMADYAETNDSWNDIAVVRVRQRILDNEERVGIAELPSAQWAQPPKSFGIVIGNGSTGSASTSSNQYAPMRIELKTMWSNSKKAGFPILAAESQIAGHGPCFSDSGGGYFAKNGRRWVLIGIQSAKRINVSCESGANTSYIAPLNLANVAWINEKMGPKQTP